MKKLFFSLLLAITANIAINAIPAYPRPVKLPMPDGTMLTIVGHGDEYRSYVTTIDGYTIVRGDDQFYHYAKLENGTLAATNIRAHEPAERTAMELSFLANTEKYITPQKDVQGAPRLFAPGQVEKPHPVIKAGDNYKGLVVLVNFNDRSFRMGNEDAKNFVTDMMNTENWTSYEDEGVTYNVTGSVRDYFRDNSYGMFNPTFDVVGPVNINYSCTYPDRHNNMGNILNAVINNIESEVDFSQYDSDNDGKVDMIYFIFAGYASSNQGNNEKYLWPHASNLYYYIRSKKNGKYLDRYACSTELYGWESRNDTQMNGIGTICHEFSHVLGYMDHYDTSDGGHETPGAWDVMDAGSYNGEYSSCPAGYNAYERYTGGFLAPLKLTTANHGDTIQLGNLQENKDAYLIKTPQNKEYFLVENRQEVKWDKGLPGHGMLMWRVDSTLSDYWYYNKVNATDRSYFQLRRANGWQKNMTDSKSDAFPGAKGISSITNETSPANMLSYAGRENTITLQRIREKDGNISFIVVHKDSTLSNPLPEGVIFRETFDECDGIGGNDDIWNASQVAGSIICDNADWSYKTAAGLNKCVRFGSGTTSLESILMPTIKLEADKTYLLTFKAAPYNTDNQNWILSVESGNATLQNADDEEAVPATSIKFKMNRSMWNDMSFIVTGSGDQVFKFKGASSLAKRILLDEVYVYDHIETAIEVIEADNKDASNNPFAPIYNLSGQRVSDTYRGIVIQNGKKYLIK